MMLPFWSCHLSHRHPEAPDESALLHHSSSLSPCMSRCSSRGADEWIKQVIFVWLLPWRKSPLSFIIKHRGGETEHDGIGDDERHSGFKPAVMSELKQAGGGVRRWGEGHVTLSGGIRSPSLSWNPYKESEAQCSHRRIHTDTYAMAITLLSVVNKRVRCPHFSLLQFQLQGQHSLAARPPTMGRYISVSDLV